MVYCKWKFKWNTWSWLFLRNQWIDGDDQCVAVLMCEKSLQFNCLSPAASQRSLVNTFRLPTLDLIEHNGPTPADVIPPLKKMSNLWNFCKWVCNSDSAFPLFTVITVACAPFYHTLIASTQLSMSICLERGSVRVMLLQQWRFVSYPACVMFSF